MGHAQDQFFEFLDDLGITDYPVEWNFVFTPEEISWQKTFFRQLRRPVIGLVIASANKEKDWRPEGYARVIDYVDRVIDMEPMIIGGPSAREAESPIKSAGSAEQSPPWHLKNQSAKPCSRSPDHT
jgi:ADP-heptose:LPS heptosyltransferase